MDLSADEGSHLSKGYTAQYFDGQYRTVSATIMTTYLGEGLTNGSEFFNCRDLQTRPGTRLHLVPCVILGYSPNAEDDNNV